MNIIEDFEDIREEAEEILDYSGFHKRDGGYGYDAHVWEIEDDDSDLNDDGGEYAMWVDLSNQNVIVAGTRDLFEGSEREDNEKDFDVKKWRGWSGTLADAIEWLAEYGLSPDIADDVIGDMESIDEDTD